MKKTIVIILAFFFLFFSYKKSDSQVLISSGTGNPDPSAMLEIQSNSKGLLIPRLSTVQRTGLASAAANGLLVFDYQTQSFYIFGNGKWTDLSVSAETWTKSSTNVFLSDENDNVGVGTSTPGGKFVIKADASKAPDDALFEIQDINGNPVFVVTSAGARIYINDLSKAASGGFAVGKYNVAKKGIPDTSYFVVSPDSTRIYTDLASSGGFAVGNYGIAKGKKGFVFFTEKDSTRIYTNTDGKASTGGFAIGKYGVSPGPADNYMYITKENYFIGHSSGQAITSGRYNLFLGYQSGHYNRTGERNTFLGHNSGYNNRWGDNNIYIGDSSGYSTIYAHDNIFIGNSSGYNTEADDPLYGSQNVFIGNFSGYKNLEGFYNVYIGQDAGHDNLNGSGNVFVGGSSGIKNLSRDNTFIGGASFYKNTSGLRNTALGAYTGLNNLTGTDNVFLGHKAGYNETGSNKLYIENSDTNDPLIYGEFDNNLVGINTSNPIAQLHVLGSATLSQILIAPSETGSEDDSELILAEDNDYTYGMSLFYDGSSNFMEVRGKSSTTTYGPHLRIERNSGASYFPAVYSDGSLDAGRRDLYINPDGQLVYNASSLRYKKNIADIEDINWLYDLRPVTFNYKESKNTSTEYGLIAEEVLLVNKDFVSLNEEGNPETVYYSRLISPILKALIEQNKKNKELEDEIHELKILLLELKEKSE